MLKDKLKMTPRKIGLKSYIIFFFISLSFFNNLNSLNEIFEQAESGIEIINPLGSNENIYERDIPLLGTDKVSYFRLSMNFKSSIDSPNFTNLFQTNREGRGLRIEQQFIGNKAQLFVQYRDLSNSERYFLVKSEYDPYRANFLKVEKNTSNRLKIWLNDILISDTQIGYQGIEFEEFAVGTGLSKSRNFHGNIKFDYSVRLFKSQPIFAYELFLAFWFAVGLSHTFIRKKLRLTKMKSHFQILDIGIVLMLSSLGVLIQSKKQFAEFFGDDFITLWPVRNISVFNVFTESIGGTFRPITETLFMIRYKLHEENLVEWQVGNLFLVGLVVSSVYLALRLLNLPVIHAVAGTLIYLTSTTFFSSMFWWSSNGTQHALSQILSLAYVVMATRSATSHDKQYFYNLHLLGLTLFLVSDLFAPLLVMSPALAFVFNYTTGQSSSSKKSKMIKERLAVRHVAIFSALSTLVVLFFRNVIADLDLATAAVSAANYKFDTVDLWLFIAQFFKYLLAFVGIVIGEEFYDLGAYNGHLVSILEYPETIVLLIAFSLAAFFTGVRNSRIVRSESKRQAGSKPRMNGFPAISRESIILLSILIVCLIPPALVPGYMQQRWTQLSFLCFLILFLKCSKRVGPLVVCTLGMISVQLYQLHINFGIELL